MATKQRYEMSEEQLQTLLEACKPVPYIIVGSTAPASPQENANNAWRRLGDEMGFLHMTVTPADGESNRVFFAVPKEAD